MFDQGRPRSASGGNEAAACQRGKKVKFYRVTELITQMLEAREERLLGRPPRPRPG
jgi:hypothetical protein